MPKELLHIKIMEEYISKMKEDEFWQKYIYSYNEKGKQEGIDDISIKIIFLGVLFFDVLNFAKKEELILLSNKYHGVGGEDTYRILKILLSHRNKYIIDFIIGLIFHIWTDITFHPLIYYITGDYYISKTAKENHRLWESVLDIYFVGDGDINKVFEFSKKYNIENIIEDKRIKDKFMGILYQIYINDKELIKLINNTKDFIYYVLKGYYNFSLYQKLYTNKYGVYLFSFLKKIKFISIIEKKFGEIISLCYPLNYKKYAKKIEKEKIVNEADIGSGKFDEILFKNLIENLYNLTLNRIDLFMEEIKKIIKSKGEIKLEKKGESLG